MVRPSEKHLEALFTQDADGSIWVHVDVAVDGKARSASVNLSGKGPMIASTVAAWYTQQKEVKRERVGG